MTNITGIVLGFLFFSGFIVGGLYAANNLFTVYNPQANLQLAGLDRISNISAETEALQQQLSSQGTNTLSGADLILTGGWAAVLSVLNTPAMIQGIIEATVDVSGLQIPVWIISLAIAAFTVFIAYRIIGIATRSESGGL
jgi:hypothetical protein